MTKEMGKKEVTPEELKERLIENALDFLERAIDELQETPKYSVINFSAAVELFLKARLMAEHWSLIVKDRQEADWNKFIVGNFSSVTLDEAVLKLGKVVRSPIPEVAKNAFRNVANHRNRVIHFFDYAHTGTSGRKKLLQSIAKEQLIAWHQLHRLLQNAWPDVFSPWLVQIENIEEKLKKHRDFLSLVFEEVEAELKEHAGAGRSVENCDACDFKSMVFDIVSNQVDEATCLVCDRAMPFIAIACTECGELVRFEGEGFSICENCGTQFEPEQLADVIEDGNAAYEAREQGGCPRGNCGDCDGYHTVVRVPGGEWIAACCLTEHDKLEACEWCGESNTGDMEQSYLSGCSVCGGHADWTKND